MTDHPIRVLVVDDDAIVRSALSAYVATDTAFRVVGQCENGAEAVDWIERSQGDIDVVMMDIRMPVMDGITAAGKISETHPTVKVLLLTSFDEDTDALNALRGGASGFLLKDSSPQAVVDALHAVHGGTTVVSPGPMNQLLKQHNRPSSRPRVTSRVHPPRSVDLSPREFDILQLLCQAHSNAEIADELVLSESTVKSHVSTIMSKLKVTSRLKAVVRAYEWGLVERT